MALTPEQIKGRLKNYGELLGNSIAEQFTVRLKRVKHCQIQKAFVK